ncbi:DUF4126 domain-containing protein [Sandaracinobacter sp. RS1-74]|uniref:DUF4126 domain-containing protein n=1 Tax=Sandaracinobacteroides sayramensis TaxID=2913411 RepID=UPI001EDABD77|nr:DUF4126 domain-containing protein [Sandaracinobacteroides sayramensis]MCG2841327.1 DUF4126 domain-containing protein [Sandaracinobacteroides sayramensis]
MAATELIALAASFSLLAGWRLYATVLVAGLAMHFDLIPLPEHLQSLDVLGSPWIIGAALLGAVAEFLADKIAWVDSAWDGVHTIIRPLGGALLALAIIDPSQPVWQIVTLLLGGGSAFLTHGAKASARAAVNTSPEPVSNVVMSGAEDVATTTTLLIALANPWIALALVALLLAATVGIFLAFRRFVKDIGELFSPAEKKPPTGG